jgi:hypothetical protein
MLRCQFSSKSRLQDESRCAVLTPSLNPILLILLILLIKWSREAPIVRCQGRICTPSAYEFRVSSLTLTPSVDVYILGAVEEQATGMAGSSLPLSLCLHLSSSLRQEGYASEERLKRRQPICSMFFRTRGAFQAISLSSTSGVSGAWMSDVLVVIWGLFCPYLRHLSPLETGPVRYLYGPFLSYLVSLFLLVLIISCYLISSSDTIWPQWSTNVHNVRAGDPR